MASWRNLDEAKRVQAEFVCPTGAETASSGVGVCCLITPDAMMTRRSPANVLGWVKRIFTTVPTQAFDASGAVAVFGAAIVALRTGGDSVASINGTSRQLKSTDMSCYLYSKTLQAVVHDGILSHGWPGERAGLDRRKSSRRNDALA
jgi:hypothetical protein